MALDPRFIITLQGKQFVMLGGLLDLAHNGGLIGIETILDKDLSDPKEQSYVFQAIGRFRTESGEAIWSAHGDASPSNSKMRGATLRHAETRAIARMLRMATNVAMCSVEELGPDGTTEDEVGPQRARPTVDGDSSGRRASAPRQQPRAEHRGDRGAGEMAQPTSDPLGALVEKIYPPVGEAICAGKACGRELTLEELRDCAREKLSRPCCAEHLLAYLKKQADRAEKAP